MITIKVKELSLISKAYLNFDEGYSNLERKTFNAITYDHSKRIEQDHGHHFCKNHPNYENVITLTAVVKDVPLLEKTDFCCEEFKEKIGISITRA